MLSPLISASLRPFLSFLVRTKTFSTHNKSKNDYDVRRKRFNAHARPLNTTFAPACDCRNRKFSVSSYVVSDKRLKQDV